MLNGPNTSNSVEHELGIRLRSVRKSVGLSQRALARRVGVPNSTISLIESGKTNPSVGALHKILDGIPIGLSEFFAFEPKAESEIFYSGDDLTEIGKGGVSLKQVGSHLVGRAIMMLEETYEVGADTGRVTYQHEGEECGIIVSGRVEIAVGDDRKILGPGDAYYFDSRRPHRFKQVGPNKCVLVSACSPPTF